MTDRFNTNHDETEPVEVQRYGPSPSRAPRPVSSETAPAWSTRPPLAAPAVHDRRGPSLVPVIAVALVVGILSGGLSAAAVSSMLRDGSASGAAPSQPITDNTNVVQRHIDESSAVITAVNTVMPAVVTIASSSNGGLFGGGASGVGSGFVYNPNGWILTNKHVVDGADKLTVQLNDTRTFDAKVIGIDTLTDLAIVKIDAKDLTAAPIGHSGTLELGQLAIAIGNPLGNFRNTVTTGVVSGLGRQIQAGDASETSSEQLNNLIQTDAAINPGNSGGPLIDSSGLVIGINTAVSNNAQGIGFAIPVDVARPIMEQAVAGKPLARPWIGVYYQQITKQLAAEQNLPVDQGVLIEPPREGTPAVFPGSPAAKAGLTDGDVVVAVDGQKLDMTHDLSALILPHEPGDTIILRVLRSDSTTELQVTLGTLPNQN
jgi:S1-C subfamily serine protease